MGFTQNLLSQLLTEWNHQPILVSYYTMLINTKVRATPFSNQFPNVGNFFGVILLLLNNLLLQFRGQCNVSQHLYVVERQRCFLNLV